MPTVSGRIFFDINRNAGIGGNVIGINDIPVALQNTDTLDTLVVLTNTTGGYEFRNVPAGNYKIVESYGLTGGVPAPGDFNTATVRTIPPAQVPSVQMVPSVPAGASNIDCVTPNTIVITVSNTDIVNQHFYNGPVSYVPLELELDPCVLVFQDNLIQDADNGTFGSFAAGTVANSAPIESPFPEVTPDLTYVRPNPDRYTPTDGEFTIQNIMNNAMSARIGAWWRPADHTVGNETGRMMVVNEDTPGEIIFRTTVAVNAHATYLFSTWIMNLFRVEGYPGPEFAVRILDEEGNPLYDSPLGFEIPVSVQFPEWKEIGGVINSLANRELVIEFFSQGVAAVGNDFAIDDIALREVRLPEFKLVKSEDKSIAAIGDIVTYTVALDNPCEQPLENVTFLDYIPVGLEFVPGSVIINGVPVPTANPLIGFPVPSIDGGTTLEVSFQALVLTVPTPNPAINRASIQYVYTPLSGGIQDSYQLSSNDTPLLVEEPVTSADLSITKAADHQTARQSATVVYTIDVTNNGPDTAREVVLSDVLPTGLIEPYFSLDDGETWQPWSGSYPLGDLENGGMVAVQIKATIYENAEGAIKNTAHIDSVTPDPNPDDNYAIVWIQIDPRIPTPDCDCDCECRGCFGCCGCCGCWATNECLYGKFHCGCGMMESRPAPCPKPSQCLKTIFRRMRPC